MANVSNGSSAGATMDPVDLWHEWYDSTAKVWSNLTGGKKETYVDPFGVYRQWMKGLEEARQQVPPTAATNPTDAWKQWFDALTRTWEQAAGAAPDLLGLSAQWLEQMEEVRAKLSAGEAPPTDPLTFALQWYNATSETWSKVVGDLIGTEEFVTESSRFMQSYVSFSKSMRRVSEEYFRALQLPTRSDVARVAGLVVAVEDKVDRIEEVFEDFEYGYSRPATAEAVQSLEDRLDQIGRKLPPSNLAQRLDQIEGKLDTRELEQRLDQIESKLNLPALTRRLDQIEGKLASPDVEQRLAKIEAKLPARNVEQRLDHVESKLDQLLAALSRLEAGRTAKPAAAARAAKTAETPRRTAAKPAASSRTTEQKENRT